MEDDDSSTNPDTWLINPNYFENNKYQWMHDMVNSYEAWGSSTGSGVTVAVIDSGVRSTHKELKNRVEVLSVADLSTDPYGNHATHVAAIIAGQMGNGYMGAGIAPDARILSLRVVDNSGSITAKNLAAAINQAVYKGADIINLSLGTYSPASAHQTAISKAVEAGVVVVAAIGNDGSNIKCYPAAYDNVIAVAAVNKDGTAATFSDFGDWADISAPGVDIYSAYATSDTSSGKMSGTSQASPVVSGVAALYLSRNPGATPAEVEEVLKKTAAKASSKEIGGIVDASRLFEQEQAAPVISVIHEEVEFNSGDTVPYHAEFSIQRENGASEEDFILFTLNGKNPSIKEGEVVSGFVYDASADNRISDLVEQYDAPLGKPFTLKALVVNNQGVASKVSSFKMVCGYNPDVEQVKITSDREISLLSGKTITLGAVVQPATANPDVLWTVDLNGMGEDRVRIDAQSGKLTTKAGTMGSVVVRATAANGAYDEITVKISQPEKAARMVIEAPVKTIAMPRVGQQAETVCLTAAAFNAKGNRLEETAFHWVSSNPSVLWVDGQTGEIRPRAKGSATITCKALDGSGKSAKSTISVTQPVEEIILSANAQVTAGSYATVKAQVLPQTANNKKVTWIIDQKALAAGAKITSGKLSLPKGFGEPCVEVTAASSDGISASVQIEVLDSKAKSVTIRTLDPRAEYNSRGVLTAASVYSVDILPAETYFPEDMENRIDLTAAADNGAMIAWSSSNPKIAEVDQNGVVLAHRAGTTKITAAALDGSNKKASVTIRVAVPASAVSFSTTQGSTSFGGNNYYVVCAGKSAMVKTTLGDAYGSPTNKKVTYQLNIYMLDYDSGVVSDIDETEVLSQTIVKKGLIKVSSSGKLSVSSSFKSFWESSCRGQYEVAVDLVGFTADGAANNYLSFIVAPYQTTGVVASANLVNDSWNEPEPAKNLVISRSSKPKIYLYSDSYWVMGYTLTSSNPSVVGVAGQKTTYDSSNKAHHITLVSGSQPGKATITAKATDGSGKSYKFTVTVE